MLARAWPAPIESPDAPEAAGWSYIRSMAAEPTTFRATAARVFLVQLIALALLWLLQSRYSG